jgi:CelD/BcsL family acetyltransferase involved in cellulose biosynthesis
VLRISRSVGQRFVLRHSSPGASDDFDDFYLFTVGGLFLLRCEQVGMMKDIPTQVYSWSRIMLLKITEINGTDQFYELKYTWNKVLERSQDNNPFLTWEYLLTCWKHFGKDKKLRILCVEDNNRIIAIAPLRQSRYRFAHLLGYDVIEPLGYMGADYTGLILAERERDCLKLMLDYLAETNDWDFIYLYDVPGTSIIPDLLPKMSSMIPKFELREGVVCPYISLPNSMDIVLKGISRKFRNNLRRCMRNLEKDFNKVELKSYAQFGSIEEAMNVHFKLNQKRWEPKSMSGVFDTKEICDFFIDVAKIFADNGWLALCFLAINEEPVAGLLCYEYNQKMYAAISGFDPNYSRYSIGNILFVKLIEKCIEKKMKEFDFLKGDESYKFKYSSTIRRNLSFKFMNKRPTSKLYHLGIRTFQKTRADKIFGKFLDF